MATYYPTSDSSFEDTIFEEENLREVIANANQRRRERTRPFTGFRDDGLPLTSTLRRGGVINLPSAYNESPIVHVGANTQPYNPGVRNQTVVNQHVTNSIRVDINKN